ncbi:MAG TPA: ABC transporter ATP-binding protein [Thermoanaerobaculia bacterium]|nr:ABC transporter ATP-binding protein [Thermoanaerobaculia bacterium]
MSVRVRALRKAFRAHEVLKGIDVDIAPGEVVGLIGPNGAGKTTLMSCLLGFLVPDAGEITFDGKANDDLDVRRRTGFVPERMNFDRGATGWNFLRYMARLAEVPDADAKSRAMLERLGLTGAADKRLSQYSRGMLQRIGMCQALIHEPAYLFLDEPTSGLDPNGVLLVRDLITEQKARGAAVLLNSHQLAEIEKVCDRVLFLHHGLIERAETLRQTDRIAVAITMLPGFDAASVATIAGAAPRENVLVAIVENEQQIATLVKTLVDAGIGIIDVRRHTTDLESIFRGAA